jgi:hypothetical protein
MSINQIKIVKVDDVVRVQNKHYMIDSINNNALTGTDIYGNKKDFFFDDIEKIVFDSAQQSSIQDFLTDTKLKDYEKNLKDVKEKLNDINTPLSLIKNLKNLKCKLEKNISDLKK